jgi:peptidoglycan DL-endopeptidase LytE
MGPGNPNRRLSPGAFQPRTARVGADGSSARWLRQLYTPRWRHHLAILVAAFSIIPFTFHPAAQLDLATNPGPGALAGLPGDATRTAVHYHTVAEGESLQSIAEQYGLAVDTLRWANGLGDLDPIVVGQELLVLPTDGVLHYLASGETARQVALYYGADPEAVAAYNGVSDPDRPLRSAQLMVPDGRPRVTQAVASLGLVGRAIVQGADVPADARRGASLLQVADKTILVVDDEERAGEAQQLAAAPAKTWDDIRAESERATAAALAESKRKSTTPVEYTVAPGDTITGLAERYGVTALTIIAANGMLDSDSVRVGQELIIPPTTGVLYRVRDDDTLSEIAQRFRVDLGPIVDYNGLDSADSLTVGQRLVIPGAEPERPKPPPPPPPPAEAPAPGTGALAAAGPGGPNGYRLASTTTSAAPAPAAVSAPASRRAEPPSAPAAPPVAASSGKGGELVGLAMRYLGYRYVFGGTTPAGFDCSGFVYYLHRQQGIPLSRGMFGQYAAGPHIPMNQLEPGDIVFFSNTYMPGLSHNGIYIGGGKFIHAADESTGVIITSLSSAYWASRYSGATRAH